MPINQWVIIVKKLFNVIFCDLCNSNRFKKTNYYVGKKYLIKCKKCRLIRLNSFKKEYDKDLYKYYDDYSESVKTKEWEERSKLNLENLIKSLNKISIKYQKRQKEISLLDFGCGLGLTLEAANKIGWNAFGIEMNDFCLKFCRKRNQKVFSDLTKINENTKFDIITLFDVIEHVSNPTDLLKKLKTKLKENGFLIITTPNWNSLERIVFQNDWKAIDPQHYHYFTKNTLINSLNKSKLVIVDLKTRNFNPFQKKVKSNKKILKDQKVTTTKLRSMSSRGIGFIVKNILNIILNIFSLGSTLEIICK